MPWRLLPTSSSRAKLILHVLLTSSRPSGPPGEETSSLRSRDRDHLDVRQGSYPLTICSRQGSMCCSTEPPCPSPITRRELDKHLAQGRNSIRN